MNPKVRRGVVAVILLTGAFFSSCTAVQESAGVVQQTDSSAPEARGASESEEVASLGPLAATRAVSPPGSLDERVAAQTEYVRSYLLEDGRLYLGLMADYSQQILIDAKSPRPEPSTLGLS